MYRSKGETTDEAFQEQRFLWERGAPIGDTRTITYTHNTLKEKEKPKSTFSDSPLSE